MGWLKQKSKVILLDSISILLDSNMVPTMFAFEKLNFPMHLGECC